MKENVAKRNRGKQPNDDKVLAQSKHIVISADGWILDKADRWFNLGAYLLKESMEDINLIVV